MTTTEQVERRLARTFAHVAEATEPGSCPNLGDGAPAVDVRPRDTPRARRSPRVALAAAAVCVLVAVGVVARDRATDQLDIDTSTIVPTTRDGSDDTIAIDDTVVEAPVDVPGFGPPVAIGADPATSAPPGVEYRVEEDGDPTDRVGITVSVNRSPGAYDALVTRQSNRPLPGGLAPTGVGHTVAGRWVAEATYGPGVPDEYERHLAFAVGDFSLVQVDTVQSTEDALDLIGRIVAPPVSARFLLPCSGRTIAEDIGDLALPPDFSRHPQRGRGVEQQTVDQACSRFVTSTWPLGPGTDVPPRSIAFVDDLGSVLSTPSVATHDREVRWSTLSDGSIGAVVSDLRGETFGVVATGLTAAEWELLADSLAGFPAAGAADRAEAREDDRAALERLDSSDPGSP